jgi:cobalt-zinc-cadmium efflux system membrane fusion protein
MSPRRTLRYRTTGLLLLFVALLLLPACDSRTTQKEEGRREQREKAGGHEHHQEPGVVKITAEAQKAAGVEVREVVRRVMSATLFATGTIELNADRLSRIGPRTAGRIGRILVSQGSRVQAGQALAYFDSPELGAVWAELVKAKGRVALNRKALSREETLFAKRVSPEKDVLKARQELAESEADLRLAQERLRLLGVNVARIESETNDGQYPRIPLVSPINGAIIEKNVSEGEVVGPEKTLFTVADLSTLWLLIDVYEKDLAQVRAGTPVSVVVTAFPDKPFRGRISYLADVVDEKTRVVRARVSVENGSGLLKPGMFATVTLDSATGQVENVITVPDEAVFFEGNERYLLIQIAAGTFAKRAVKVGRTFGRQLELTEGVREGEMIVVKGVFPIKAELKKESLGDEH